MTAIPEVELGMTPKRSFGSCDISIHQLEELVAGLPEIRGVLSTLNGEEYVVCSQAGLHLGGQGALLQGVVQPCNHYKKQWISSWF